MTKNEAIENDKKKIHDEVRTFMDKQRELMQTQIQFAESKHTVLLAFNGASVVGSIAALVALGDKIFQFPFFLISLYAINVLPLCSVAVFYNLASMYAQRHQFKVASKSMIHDGNLVFWGAIADQENGKEYLKNVLKQYWSITIQDSESDKWNYELHSANQTHILAGIARRKYNLFNESVHWTMAGLLTPFAIIIQKYFLSPDLGIKEPDGYMYFIQPLKKLEKL